MRGGAEYLWGVMNINEGCDRSRFFISKDNPMGRFFSVVPPLQSEEVRQRLPKSKFSENFHIMFTHDFTNTDKKKFQIQNA